MNNDKEKIRERLGAFREEMKKAGVSAAIVPQTDPHLGEYIADHWQLRRWLSGFTGSAGTLVFTPTETLLWTDSRYFLQAARQLEGSGITLMKEGLPDSPTIVDYLCGHLVKGSTVGIDGMLFSHEEARRLRRILGRGDLKLDTHFDASDAVWVERPELPEAPVFVHSESYAGQSATDKIAEVLRQAGMEGANAILVSDLAEIAWVLNIRSQDVKYNPVATSFLYLSGEGSSLFINSKKIDEATEKYLDGLGIGVRPYGDVADFLRGMGPETRVLMEPGRVADTLVEAAEGSAVLAPSPIPMLKAVKNEKQMEGERQAMRSDGIALVRGFMELERRLTSGERVTEIDVAQILTHFRSLQPGYFDDSFETIAGYGPHGAIVHYSARPDTDAALEPHGLLLVDSGAQYLYGTTDITRTWALGTPTAQEKADYTLVLKGHIALACAVFPEGTCGTQLDVLARQYLWRAGLTYLHGTGHGVGHFLNVHEGPMQFRTNHVPAALRPGMVMSDEPGIYREGVHGVRIENLMAIREAMTTEFGHFYSFETLTLCPYDRRLIDLSLLSPQELQWVNAYHAEVYHALSPALTIDEKNWLAERTAPLSPKP